MTATEHPQDRGATPPYEIRASARRTRSVTAFREGGRIVVVVPASLSERRRRDIVPGLVQQFLGREARRRPPRSDGELTLRAGRLWDADLADVLGPPPAFGVRWSEAQRSRWGSCTPDSGEIRLSTRLRQLPDWVVDYVLVHELVHLVEPHHSARFWKLVGRHPGTERARGFLEGVEHVGVHGTPAG